METGGRERHEGPMRFGVSVSQREEMYFKAQRPSERIYHFTVERHSFYILELNSNPAKFSDKTYTGVSVIRLKVQQYRKYGEKGLSVGRAEEDQHSPGEQIEAAIGD